MFASRPFHRFVQRIARSMSSPRRTLRRRRSVPSYFAAEVQRLETRQLLSGVLTDTTQATPIGVLTGANTGNAVLATFSDSIPQGGLNATLNPTGPVSPTVTPH